MPRGSSHLEEAAAAWQRVKVQARSQDTWGRSLTCCSCRGWPLSSGPHCPVHTARWPESPATLFSPLWMVLEPEWCLPAAQRPAAASLGVSTFQELVSLLAPAASWNTSLSALFPALSRGQPQARDAIFQAEASPHP